MDSSAKIATSSILLLLSVLSFIPQYRKIVILSTCEQLSLYYLLCNTLLATQNLSYGLILQISEVWDKVGPSPGKPGWLELMQHIVVWLGNLFIFTLCLRLAPAGYLAKRIVLGLFCGFSTVTIVPVLLLILIPKPAPHSTVMDNGHMLLDAQGMVLGYTHPIATCLGVCAFAIQAHKLWSTSGNIGAVSLSGLALQAIVFSLVAISWTWRLYWPREEMHPDDPRWDPAYLRWVWYLGYGWATINNALFAACQGLLFVLAWQVGRGGRSQDPSEVDERTRLL